MRVEKDTLQQLRLDFVQGNIRRMRSICEWSGSDLAELLGVSRQSINNLETGKSKLTPPLLLALLAILEEFCRKSPDTRDLLDLCVARFPQVEAAEGAKATVENLCHLWLLEYSEQFARSGESSGSNNAQTSVEIIEAIASRYKIFIGPDILFSAKNVGIVEDVCLAAKEAGNVVNLPVSAFNAVAGEIGNQTMERIAEMQRAGALVLRGDEDDPPWEKLLIEKFLTYMAKYEICLITNNDKLAHDITMLNNMKSMDSNPIIVLKIDGLGHLRFYDCAQKELICARNGDERPSLEGSFNVCAVDSEESVAANSNPPGWSEL